MFQHPETFPFAYCNFPRPVPNTPDDPNLHPLISGSHLSLPYCFHRYSSLTKGSLPKTPCLVPSQKPKILYSRHSKATDSQKPTEKQKLNQGALRRDGTCTNLSNRPPVYLALWIAHQ